MELADRVALVTGGSGGIGRAACLGFARAGASVVVHYQTGADAAEDVARTIVEAGGNAITARADLSDEQQVSELMAVVADFAGPRGLGVLFNNAAIYPTGGLEEIEPAEWDRVMAVNVRGPFLCVRAAVPLLRQAGWGRIINIGSHVVFRGTAGMLHYATSKSAMTGFTRALARELGEYDVTVNCIVPSVVMTPTAEKMYTDEAAQALVSLQVVPRAERPEDLLGLLLFLASEASAFVTGQTIMVDGGRLGA
jgi:NAD(P)-dependent dehydrogenase (short-subunit alcohol dehydrogenase family)